MGILILLRWHLLETVPSSHGHFTAIKIHVFVIFELILKITYLQLFAIWSRGDDLKCLFNITYITFIDKCSQFPKHEFHQSKSGWILARDRSFDAAMMQTCFLHRIYLHHRSVVAHDDDIKWKHFPCHWPFVRGFHRSPVNSPHKGQWRRALMFSLICVWINVWVNNRQAGDLRRYRAHYDVIIMPRKYSIVATVMVLHLENNKLKTRSIQIYSATFLLLSKLNH